MRIERSQGNPSWEIIYDINGLEGSAVFSRFLGHLYDLNRGVPLVSFSVQRYEMNKNQYSYSFIAKDGRLWSQTLLFTGADVRHTFAVPAPGFIEPELVLHRNTRSAVIDMITVNRVSKIECSWA